jgi:hypothetical protein
LVPLFQGRFKAILHEPDEAVIINRYIHLNPVRVKAAGGHEGRAGSEVAITKELARQRVEILEQFPWSSYGYFAGTRTPVDWLSTHEILGYFSQGSVRKRQATFRRQLREAAATEDWETDWKNRLKYTVLLGSTEFVAQMRKLLQGDQDQQTGLRHASKEALDWTQIIRAVTKAWGRPWEELLHARACGARETALFLGRTRARLTLKELGSLSGGLRHNAVSIAIRRFSLRLQSDRALERKLALIEKTLDRM